MSLTADDISAAERYLASPEATPEGIRTVRRWLELEWAQHIEEHPSLWLRPPESNEDHARELAFPESTCSQK